MKEKVMTKRQFFNAVSNGGDAVLRRVLDLLKKARADYCVIGGLAVNAYVEPVVSLDLDIVVITDALDTFLSLARRTFKIERFPHSSNPICASKYKSISATRISSPVPCEKKCSVSR
jgi:hypothetical protein